MGRLTIGCVCVALGIVLALVGRPALGADLHPVTTGLIAVGLVMAGVALAERRIEARGEQSRHPVLPRSLR